MILDDRVKGLLDGRAFAVLATLNPDGTPQTSVIWAARDGDVLIFSTHDRRRKAQNLRRDPRASVTVFAADDPYRTVDIRGTVERSNQLALTDPDELVEGRPPPRPRRPAPGNGEALPERTP